jgi:hypothetical protein
MGRGYDAGMVNFNELIGTHDLLFVTLDALRYDVARDALARGRTPNLAALLPGGGWEERHSPGNFTFAAHQAFFHGFLPTPAVPGKHPRLFAASFPGSETTGGHTWVYDAPDIVTALKASGYHTVCIGGVGFFNPTSALGRVLPGLFAESHWRREFGVTDPRSTENQVAFAVDLLGRLPASRRVFLFLNVSAVHQPNYFYLQDRGPDTLATHAAALAYVDGHLPELFRAVRRRGPAFCILCSDHGTAYGEEGYTGHRLSHPAVWTVPYAEFLLPGEGP